MGGGYHGGFGKTLGAAAGDAVFQSEPGQFFLNIAHRADIDKNGVFDVVAHGGTAIILITHNGKTLEINSRTAAKLIKAKSGYKRGQPIRLLACNTGASANGFAQNLANKLGVIVEAPTKVVWAYPNGRYVVADRRKENPQLPDLSNRGIFKKFYPGGKKK
jgi:filamentous hemagglutinin